MLKRSVLLLAMSFALAIAGGCSQQSEPKKDYRTAAQYFKEEQVNTVTPHGRIRTETVTERDGRIEYQTDNGMKWAVRYTKRADGTYHYQNPERTDK